MKNQKFTRGDKVIADGKSSIVVVSQKKFSTGEMFYKLEDGRKVLEEHLKLDVPDDDTSPLKKLHMEYERVLEKPVPSNKKNDVKWLQDKIDEASEDVTPDPVDSNVPGDDVPGDDDPKYSALAELDLPQLQEIVKSKGLEIDLQDYETAEDLLIAICEELEIEIPQD